MSTKRSKKCGINSVTSTHSTRDANINISVLQIEKMKQKMYQFDHLMLLSAMVTSDKDSISRFLAHDFINIFQRKILWKSHFGEQSSNQIFASPFA